MDAVVASNATAIQATRPFSSQLSGIRVEGIPSYEYDPEILPAYASYQQSNQQCRSEFFDRPIERYRLLYKHAYQTYRDIVSICERMWQEHSVELIELRNHYEQEMRRLQT